MKTSCIGEGLSAAKRRRKTASPKSSSEHSADWDLIKQKQAELEALTDRDGIKKLLNKKLST